MSARRTVDDHDQWVPFLEAYRGDPPGACGRRAGVLPRPVTTTAAVVYAVVVIAFIGYLLSMLVFGAVAPMAALGVEELSEYGPR